MKRFAAILGMVSLPLAVAHASGDAGSVAAAWGPKWGFEQGAAAADPVMVAEFRADELPADPGLQGERERFNAGLSARFNAAGSNPALARALDPLELQSYSLDGSLSQGGSMGGMGLAAVLDYRMRHSLRLDLPYTDSTTESVFRFGPEVSLTPGLSTRLYYRQGRDTADLLRPYGDFEFDDVSGAGLSQTWWISDLANVELGYEFEQHNATDRPYSMEGHRVNLAGRIPIRWGVHARFEAAYSWNSYPEYFGTAGLESDRRAVSAGLAGSLGEQLSGSVMFHYADETFDDDFLSYRRSAWGLNLHYAY